MVLANPKHVPRCSNGPLNPKCDGGKHANPSVRLPTTNQPNCATRAVLLPSLPVMCNRLRLLNCLPYLQCAIDCLAAFLTCNVRLTAWLPCDYSTAFLTCNVRLTAWLPCLYAPDAISATYALPAMCHISNLRFTCNVRLTAWLPCLYAPDAISATYGLQGGGSKMVKRDYCSSTANNPDKKKISRKLRKFESSCVGY